MQLKSRCTFLKKIFQEEADNMFRQVNVSNDRGCSKVPLDSHKNMKPCFDDVISSWPWLFSANTLVSFNRTRHLNDITAL